MSPVDLELSLADDAPPARPYIEVPAVLASILVHLAALILLALITIPVAQQHVALTLFALPSPPRPEMPILLENLQIRDVETHLVGADGEAGRLDAMATAPMTAAIRHVPPLLSDPLAARSTVPPGHGVDLRGRDPAELTVLRGHGGMAMTAAEGAIDRITHEILLSLEQRPTLVVWLLDQSGSLTGQRDQIRRRLDRIYRELDQIPSVGIQGFHGTTVPLLSSVVAFGSEITLRTKDPTADVAQLQAAIGAIEVDDSGVERAFSAVQFAVQKYRRFRTGSASKPARNVMLVLFCDEAGDDQQLMDRCVNQCRQLEIPVYVVGIPAPLGREESIVKWVDPDPSFDQSPRWGRVHQGPESLLPELVRLRFVDDDRSLDTLDSGFGPYALTRLCVETGGIYFTVHPNRQTTRPISASETAPYSAYLRNFFAADVMRKYRPEYISANEYQRRLKTNQARAALVAAARMSGLAPMENPQRRFVFRDEAQFHRELSEAQKAAARLSPRVDSLYEILKKGELDRAREETPRWQAGFDLAMGRVLAMKVRTDGYNAMLAGAKGGLPTDEPGRNSWLLRTSQHLDTDSKLEKLGRQATEYLQRVVDDHPGTPWALLAQKELQSPFGWEWQAYYTDLSPPADRMANNGEFFRDDQRRMLPRPAPSRPVPRL